MIDDDPSGEVWDRMQRMADAIRSVRSKADCEAYLAGLQEMLAVASEPRYDDNAEQRAALAGSIVAMRWVLMQSTERADVTAADIVAFGRSISAEPG